MFLRLLQSKMAPSPDCAATSLLCGEDNNSLFDNADHGAAVEELEIAWRHRSRRSRDQEKSFNGGEFFFIWAARILKAHEHHLKAFLHLEPSLKCNASCTLRLHA